MTSMNNKLTDVLEKVEHAYPGLGQTARLVLAAAAATRLQRKHPLAVILIGGPSTGKTSLLMPLTKGGKDSSLANSVLRVDDFTPASLVSHSANRKSTELSKTDLLPKMRDKCVVTKEMAPLFTGHEDELMKKFAVLASVLDGEGYISSSGNHGQRGYTDPITFTLLGAVTPEVLMPRVYSALTAIGSRFCFWEMPHRLLDPGSWRGAGSDRNKIELDAAGTLISFLDDFFGAIPPGSIQREQFTLTETDRVFLSNTASLMALLRSKITIDKDDEGKSFDSSTSTENPDRAFRYLEQIVFGSAILEDRRDVAITDLHLALGIALGSATPRYRKIARIFFEADAVRTVQDLTVRTGLDEGTVMKYTRQLQSFDVLVAVNPDGTTAWDLKEPFKKLRSHMLSTGNPQPEQAE
jgi:hypothetical protein